MEYTTPREFSTHTEVGAEFAESGRKRRATRMK